MIVWRLSSVPALDGKGGMRESGRWHTRGQRIIYTGETTAGILLEVLVHLDVEPDEIPDNYRLLQIEIPDGLGTEHARMNAGWERHENISRAQGDAWLEACSKPLMRVPSAIVPATCNVLVNPRHPDAKRIKLKADEAFRFDPRLLA